MYIYGQYKRLGLFQNQSHTALHDEITPFPRNQVPKINSFCLVQRSFSNPTIGKPMAPAFQNTLTFAQYFFSSRSSMRVNLVHWNSMQLKKASLPTFSGQTPLVLSENHKTRTYNLHHRKFLSVTVILSLRVGVYYKQIEVNNFFRAVAVECALYLARPHKGSPPSSRSWLFVVVALFSSFLC